MNKAGGKPEENNNELKGGNRNIVLQKKENSMINIIMLQDSQIKKKTVTGINDYKYIFYFIKVKKSDLSEFSNKHARTNIFVNSYKACLQKEENESTYLQG